MLSIYQHFRDYQSKYSCILSRLPFQTPWRTLLWYWWVKATSNDTLFALLFMITLLQEITWLRGSQWVTSVSIIQWLKWHRLAQWALVNSTLPENSERCYASSLNVKAPLNEIEWQFARAFEQWTDMKSRLVALLRRGEIDSTIDSEIIDHRILALLIFTRTGARVLPRSITREMSHPPLVVLFSKELGTNVLTSHWVNNRRLVALHSINLLTNSLVVLVRLQTWKARPFQFSHLPAESHHFHKRFNQFA